MKYFLFILVFIFTQFATISHSNTDVVFLDINYVLTNSNKGKSLLQELEKKNNSNLSKLESKEKILKALEIDIEKKKNIISKDELKKNIENLKSQIVLFRNEKDKLVKEFNNLKNSEILKLMDLINPIISDYVTKNSINIVIDKKNIIIGKKSYDITNEILLLVNENVK
ncbi:OmpH family outer membrane protein [Candidatus Pelagibacter sp.]|nr:OmpH family outer membrane protein [Candidatus Pelagibacter sp.]